MSRANVMCTFNAAYEATGTSGTITPEYDAAGSLIATAKPDNSTTGLK